MAAKDRAEIAGFRAYLNYDGRGSRFADQGLNVLSEDPAGLSIYAAIDSKDSHRLTVVLINKTDKSHTQRLSLNGFKPRTAKAFTISGTNFDRSTQGSASVTAEGVAVEMSPLSVTTLEVTGQ